MEKDIALLRRFAEFAFGSLERTCESLTEKEADWRPVEEANNARWILNHLSRISNLSIPRILTGDPEYIPDGWPEDYREQEYKVKKLMADIKAGKKQTIEGLTGLQSKDLDEEIPLWGGTRKREFALFAYLGEIINHRGQIAALRGNIKRRREKDPNFLA
ncbi:MAG: DinB family protein [Candidatus Bathyarchaeota archaeon]